MARGRIEKGGAERVNIFESESSGQNVYDVLRALGSLQVTAVEDPYFRVGGHEFSRTEDHGNAVEINVDAVLFNREEEGQGLTDKDIQDALTTAWDDMKEIVFGSPDNVDRANFESDEEYEEAVDAVREAIHKSRTDFIVDAGDGGMSCPSLKCTTNLGALYNGGSEFHQRDAIRANQSKNEALHIETYPPSQGGPVVTN